MSREKIEVMIPSELGAMARKLADGETIACLDDVVAEALQRFLPHLQQRQNQHRWLKAEVQKGIDELERGETVDEDAAYEEVNRILGRTAEPVA